MTKLDTSMIKQDISASNPRYLFNLIKAKVITLWESIF